MAILRLELRLEIDTQTKEARVVGQSGQRFCPGPCGGNPLPTSRHQHCSLGCRTYMRSKNARELAEAQEARRLTFEGGP